MGRKLVAVEELVQCSGCGLKTAVARLSAQGGRCAGCGQAMTAPAAQSAPQPSLIDPFAPPLTLAPVASVAAVGPMVIKQDPRDPDQKVVAPMGDLFAEGEEVTITWGKELYSPKQFHTYEVGPFVWATRVRNGETRAAAAARLQQELNAFAEGERERKKQSYLRMIGG